MESSHSESEAAAKRLLAQRLGQIAAGQFAGVAPEKVRISDLAELVIRDYECAKKRSISDVRERTKLHIDPLLGNIRASQFSQAHVRKYVSKRRQEGAADASINRELAVIRRGFTLAMQNEPPLVLRIPHIARLEEDNARAGFVEHSQYVALREKLPAHLKCLLVVGYHVGCRIGELRKVRWDQVDLSAKEIRLSKAQTKGKKPRTLPIYGDMREWMQFQKEDRDLNWPGCPLVFHYHGRPIGSHIKGWTKACKDAGLAGLLFHDLRRSAVRNMERAGIPRKIAMEISGHRTEAVYRRYDIVSPQDLRMAAAKMDAYLSRFQAEQPAVTEKNQGKVN
jgi:integrase